jgi:predicted nucleotidyltransferase
MRLDAGEIEAIRRAALAVFGAGVRVRVFGSRARDDLKGGDLDLWLEVAPGAATLANERRFRDLIARPLDDLKVDLVLHESGRPLSPIDQIACRDGVLL